MPLSFATYDVFTDAAFAGNPLAIVFGADSLDDAAMQTIAREFNLSETTFVRRARAPHHSAEVRIFTPGRELPFAGHPTIGTAIAMAEREHGDNKELDVLLVLEEKVGPVRCAVKLAQKGAAFAEFDLPQLPRETGSGAAGAEAVAMLGLKGGDIGFDRHTPSAFSAGVPYDFVPVSSLDALARAKPTAVFSADKRGTNGVYVYARAAPHAAHAFHARMFAPEIGIVEDPATGSAAAAFAGVVAKFDTPGDGWIQTPILQGAEMGRPSLIGLEFELSNGKITGARISGKAVKVSEGQLFI